VKNKLLCRALFLLLLFSPFAFSQNPRVSGLPKADKTENISATDLKKRPNPFQKKSIFDEILAPNLTAINFDDIIFSDDNSIPISSNRYAGVNFYAPYVATWLTWNRRYSQPNSLIVGYVNYNGTAILSVDSLVIDFAQPAKDVAFLWGTDHYYNSGVVEIYENTNQLTASFTVNIGFGNWVNIQLNQFSQRIRRIVLRRPSASYPAGFGHIFLDNFQFTPNPSSSPVGLFR
jgi:hypothetical protein